MTIGRLFAHIFRIVLLIACSYCPYHLFIDNNGLNTFDNSFSQNGIFAFSFFISVLYVLFHLVCFTFYLIYNKGKSVAIVFSYRHLKEDYWKDVNRCFNS